MPYPNEHSCRLREPEGLDIVGSGERKTDGKTYRVIFGKPESGDGSVEQAYRYPIESWTEAEARKHCRTHDGKFHPATREANLGPLHLRFFASLQSWEEKDGRHLATFYLMDDSVNLNNWRVTREALEKALPDLLGKPLSAKPGYRVDHTSSPLDVGSFVQVRKPDGYAIGVAEITDELAWGKIKNGEWGPVSCEITAKKVTCSLCGKDILAEPCEHVLSREAHEIISEFGFDRFALVSEPAYPMAGILFAAGKAAGVIAFQETRRAPEGMSWDFSAADYDVAQLRRACAWYDSSNPDVKGSCKLPHHLPDGRVVWRGASAAMAVLLGAREGVDIPAGDRRGVYNHLRRHYEQFDKEPPEFHASQSPRGDEPKGALDPEVKEGEKRVSEKKIAELQTKLDAVTAEKKKVDKKLAEAEKKLAEKSDLETKVKDLQSKLDEIRTERHLERVAEVVDLRLQAGLTNDRKAETEKLKELDDKTLEIMKGDVAAFIAEKERITRVAGPKAKFAAGAEDEVQKKIEETRERFFGHRNSPQQGGND